MIVNGYFLNRRSLRHRTDFRLILSFFDPEREEPGGSGGPVSRVRMGDLRDVSVFFINSSPARRFIFTPLLFEREEVR